MTPEQQIRRRNTRNLGIKRDQQEQLQDLSIEPDPNTAPLSLFWLVASAIIGLGLWWLLKEGS